MGRGADEFGMGRGATTDVKFLRMALIRVRLTVGVLSECS